MKQEVRVLGIDDAPFDKFNPLEREVLVVGTLFRGGSFLDGLLSTKVEKDGSDATAKLVEMINNSKFKPQVQAILLDGIALGGFNVVNVSSLSEETGIPVVVVVRNMPDVERFIAALEKLGMREKAEMVRKMPKPVRINKVYAQLTNIPREQARELLRICSPRSHVPEAIRVAHLIASGIVLGESRGNA